MFGGGTAWLRLPTTELDPVEKLQNVRKSFPPQLTPVCPPKNEELGSEWGIAGTARRAQSSGRCAPKSICLRSQDPAVPTELFSVRSPHIIVYMETKQVSVSCRVAGPRSDFQ